MTCRASNIRGLETTDWSQPQRVESVTIPCPAPYQLEFYVDAAGNSPVERWFQELEEVEAYALGSALDGLLQESGPLLCFLRPQYASSLGRGLYEFRLEDVTILGMMARSWNRFLKQLKARANRAGPVHIATLEALQAHYSRLGRELAAERKRLDVTQASLAKTTGIYQAEISRIEHSHPQSSLGLEFVNVDVYEGLNTTDPENLGRTPRGGEDRSHWHDIEVVPGQGGELVDVRLIQRPAVGVVATAQRRAGLAARVGGDHAVGL
jgi:DNA-binding XRE family transcriptional regulator